MGTQTVGAQTVALEPPGAASVMPPMMTFEQACQQVVSSLTTTVPMSFWSVSQHENGRQV